VSDQSCLDFGLGPEPRRPKRPERAFSCIDAGGKGAAIDAIRKSILRQYGLQYSPVPTGRLHLSISMYGDFKRIPSRIPFAVDRAAQRICVPPFEITLDRAATLPGGRPGKRPIVLLCDSKELIGLADTLLAETTRIGLKATALKIPHMTLFYSPDAIPAQPIEPIRIPVRRFFLIHSELWLTRYNVLGCWPLGEQVGPASRH
jgi:2'-5' RNA ligase